MSIDASEPAAANTETAEKRTLKAAAMRVARSKFVTNWFRRILLTVVLIAAAWTISRNWDVVWGTVQDIEWHWTVLSFLSIVVGIGLGTLAWQTIVDDLGHPIGRFRGAQINLVGALGKYVPGTVWAYLLQMELGRKVGLGRVRIFTGSLIQLGLAVVATIIFGVAGLPVMLGHAPGAIYLVAVLPFALAALHPRILTWGTNLVLKLLRRKPLDRPLRFSAIVKALSFQLASYFCYGLHVWLLAQAIGVTPGLPGLLLCTAAVTIGLNSGVVAFVLPSGAGVRDLAIVGLLMTAMPYAQALPLAVVSRLMFTVGDLVSAGAAAGLARWRSPEMVPIPTKQDD